MWRTAAKVDVTFLGSAVPFTDADADANAIASANANTRADPNLSVKPMNILTNDQAIEWCVSHKFVVDGGVPAQDAKDRTLTVECPESFRALIRALDVCLGWEAEGFEGGLLWFTEWGIWSEQLSGELIELMRGGANHRNAALRKYPAQLHSASEFDLMYAFVAIAALARWDAWFIPTHTRHAFRMSHHGFIDLIMHDASELPRATAYFAEQHTHARLK